MGDESNTSNNNPYENTSISIKNTDTSGVNSINKTRFSIAGKILNIIENVDGGEIDNTEILEIEKYMRKYIKLNFKKIEQFDLVPIFNKYFNKDKSLNSNTFNPKFDKYFPIHFPILINQIKGELFGLTSTKNNNKETTSEKENIVLNILKKYSYILFIFGEKISLTELTKVLKLDLKIIGSLRQSVSQNMKLLGGFETKQIKKLEEESKLTNKINNSSEKKETILLTDPFCATTYRNAFRKVMSEGEDITIITSLNAVGEEIEKLYKLEFRELFIVFKKWYDSDGSFGYNMHQIEDAIKKILGSITTFKDSDIAFTESFSSNIRQKKFLNDINKELINGNIPMPDKNKEIHLTLIKLFKEFIEMSVNNLEVGDFLEFVKKLDKLKKETAESKIPTSLKYINNINIEKITFDDWDSIHESQKNDLLFSDIVSNKGKILLSKYLKLDNIDPGLVLLFTESYGFDYNIVFAQFQEIKGLAKAGISLSDFVDNDINNLNLLIIWWKFLLKARKLKKEKKEITKENIKNIEEKPSGINAIISEHLKEKGILESNKLEFIPDGKLNNISIQTIPEQLKNIFKGFKSGPIDLKESKVNVGESDILIKDITDFYIPSQGSNKNIDSDGPGMLTNINIEINLINDWLNTGIDLCYNLVKNKPILDNNQKKYLKLLEKNKIVPENLTNLSIENKDNIKNLVETLKYIKKQRHNLKDMMLIGNSDKNKLISILGPLLDKTKDKMAKDCFGPDKSFIRAFTKLIKLYSGDFTQFGDLTRLRVVEDNISDMVNSIVNFISFSVGSEEITHISIVDNIGEPISEPRKKSGYRDVKLFLNLKGGNVVEVQFQYKEMLEVKEAGMELANGKNPQIFEKLKKEEMLFKIDEMREFLTVAIKKNIELPTADILNNLLRDGNVYGLINELGIEENELILKNISTNYTYNFLRQLPKDTKVKTKKDSDIKTKIVKLERILSDYTWSGAVLKDLISKGVKTK